VDRAGDERTQCLLTKEEMTNCVWLEPDLVAQIEFTEWTPDIQFETLTGGSLRQSKHWG
jgi:ATP-dependent DNA ligase